MSAALAGARRSTDSASVRGFAADRTASLFVAVAFLGISTPQLLNFFRIVPVVAVLLLIALHLGAAAGRGVSRTRFAVAPLLLVGWLGATTFWSDGRFLSIVQSASTLMVVLVAALVGTTCSFRALVRGVALGGLLVLALSLAVALAAPGTGLMPDGYQGGALRGLYVHRNLLAEVLTPAYLAALCMAIAPPRALLKRLVLAAVLLGGILLTRSSTALAAVAAATGVALLVFLVQRVPRRFRQVPLVGAVAVVAAGAIVVVNNPADVLALLGRDSTLTGRALIWQIVQQLIARRPLTGYGWGATWDPTDPIGKTVSTLAKFDVPSAHNGYLDAWIQAGAIGLGAFLLLVAVVVVRGVRLVLRSESPLARWAPVFVSAVLVYNIGEADLDSPLVIFLLTATLTRLLTAQREGEATLEPTPADADQVMTVDRPAWSRRSRATISHPTDAATV